MSEQLTLLFSRFFCLRTDSLLSLLPVSLCYDHSRPERSRTFINTFDPNSPFWSLLSAQQSSLSRCVLLWWCLQTVKQLGVNILLTESCVIVSWLASIWQQRSRATSPPEEQQLWPRPHNRGPAPPTVEPVTWDHKPWLSACLTDWLTFVWLFPSSAECNHFIYCNVTLT